MIFCNVVHCMHGDASISLNVIAENCLQPCVIRLVWIQIGKYAAIQLLVLTIQII